MTATLPADLLDRLRRDATDVWPGPALGRLQEAGVTAWPVPEEYGGRGVADLAAAYVDLADADLTACFFLTQQNSAVGRLAAAGGDAAAEWLPKIASGDALATVGISHLSTSRQHAAEPPVAVRFEGDDILLDGVVPWSTGATRADVIVTGGVMPDGLQVLAAVPTAAGGVRPGEPMSLMALSGSETGVVHLEGVRVPRAMLVAAPCEGVMSSGKAGGTGSLTTSALAVGLSQRAARLLDAEAEKRPDVAATAAPIREEFTALRGDLLRAAGGEQGEELTAESLRKRANSLALRSSQAALVASKGAGFVVGHPAERAVREAMFFLVWSCPRPVAEAAMQEFACRLFG